MICPYCNKEMKKGVLSGDGRSTVSWKEGDKKANFWDKIGGVCNVDAMKYTLATFSAEAHYCPDCKKMIIDTDIG